MRKNCGMAAEENQGAVAATGGGASEAGRRRHSAKQTQRTRHGAAGDGGRVTGMENAIYYAKWKTDVRGSGVRLKRNDRDHGDIAI